MKKGLKAGPIPVAMAIPDCNDGKYFRGGDGGVCKNRKDDGSCLNMRGCSDSELMKAYEHHDIIMSEERNKCMTFYPDKKGKSINRRSMQ
jgi:hypothetical protein